MKNSLKNKVLCILVSFVIAFAFIPNAWAEESASLNTEPDPASTEILLNDAAEGIDYVAGEVIVVFEPGAQTYNIESTLSEEHLEVTEDIKLLETDSTVKVVEIAEGKTVPEAIEDLENMDGVAHVQPNYLYSQNYLPNDPDLLDQLRGWHLSSINVCDSWDLVKTNQTVGVAVIDSGVNISHQDLSYNLDINNAYNSVSETHGAQAVVDLEGHGTHVAGIIAAQADNSLGTAGVSYNAKLIPIKVVFDSGSEKGKASTATLIKGLEYAISLNTIKVVNISMGGNQVDPALKTWIDAAVNRGITVVCAAGNSGDSVATYPSDYESVISVIELANDDSKTNTSSYGTAKDISAPESNIWSTYVGSTNSYTFSSGTSMAAPMVSGVVALMYAVKPGISVSEIKNVLYASSTDLGTSGFDPQFGWGKVNAYAAIEAIVSQNTTPPLLTQGVYTISSALSTTKTVDISGATKENGGNAQMFSNNETPAQRFFISFEGDFCILKNVNSEKVLDVAGAGTRAGTNVWQYAPNGTAAQKWILEDTGDGYYSLRSVANGLYLDVSGASTSNGANLQVYTGNGTKAQKFKFTSTRTVQDGTYRLESALDAAMCVDVSGASKYSGANVQLWQKNNTKAQEFSVRYNATTGYYTITNTGSGKVLDVASASRTNGANVQQYDSNNTDAQKWAMRNSGDFALIYSACSGLVLDVAGAQRANGTNIHMYVFNDTAAQKFLLRH